MGKIKSCEVKVLNVLFGIGVGEDNIMFINYVYNDKVITITTTFGSSFKR